jgi:hypothetical protein
MIIETLSKAILWYRVQDLLNWRKEKGIQEARYDLDDNLSNTGVIYFDLFSLKMKETS